MLLFPSLDAKDATNETQEMKKNHTPDNKA
jgi:hypothetical protein